MTFFKALSEMLNAEGAPRRPSAFNLRSSVCFYMSQMQKLDNTAF